MSNDFWEGYVPEPDKRQQALDKKAENARELGLDYEPAQQEPVATDWERIARVQDAKLRAMCNESGGFEKLCEVMDRYEHTSPQPAQQEPVAFLVDGDLYYPEEIDWETLQEQGHTVAPLYTSPPAQRKPLTDEEIWKFWWSRPEVPEGEDDSMEATFVAAVRRVLAAHGIKEKNNG